MKKSTVLEAILKRLREDLALHFRAAATARAEATDEQSKAENKYDTRGLEASYLARGQARQAVEIQGAIESFEILAQAAPPPADAVSMGSLVELRTGAESEYYLIGPKAGGVDVVVSGHEVTVLTPQSPLGQRIMNLSSGAPIPKAPGERGSTRVLHRIL